MCRPFTWGFVHVDGSCGHVLVSQFGHSVQFGFGWVGQKIFLWRFPMYWAHQFCCVWVICVFEMPLVYQMWFDSL